MQQTEHAQTLKNSDEIHYAKGFTITHTTHYKKLTILNPWNNYQPYASYYLLLDSIQPEIVSGEPAFFFTETPKSIALHTVAQAYALHALDLKEKVSGITDPRFFYDPYFEERLNNGTLIQTSNEVQMNMERILFLKPDLVICSGWNSISTDYQQLINFGIPPLFMMEWMEEKPLGRAEWIKAIGFIFNKEKQTDSIFQGIEKEYNALKNQCTLANVQPKVIHGEEYNGVWYVAGGESFIASIYKDAGANYLWSDNEQAGSLTVDVEVVIEKGAEADFWLTTFGQNSLDIATIQKEKFSMLKSVQKNQIYSNTKRVVSSGGNDFWETGNLRVDLILHDIAQIIHPEIFKSDSLFFYRRLNINEIK